MDDFTYLGFVLCKYGGIEEETRETAMQGRKVSISLVCVYAERKDREDGSKKKTLWSSIIPLIYAYACETLIWVGCQRLSNGNKFSVRYLC